MKRILIFCMLIFHNITTFGQGQDMTSFFKQKIEERLAQMDCENAQKMYNAFLESGGRADSNISTRIKICSNFKLFQAFLSLAMTSNPTYSLNNGTYKGQTSDGQRFGLGAYYWKDDKEFYFGGYKNDDKNGNGIYIAGNLENRKILNCPRCTYYSGNWSDGKKSGTGTCYDKTGKLIYYGDFKDDIPTDTYPSTGLYTSYKFEIINLLDNGLYIGETKDGKRHGYGLCFWKDGGMWFGNWKDDTRNGYGIYININGAISSGTY